MRGRATTQKAGPLKQVIHHRMHHSLFCWQAFKIAKGVGKHMFKITGTMLRSSPLDFYKVLYVRTVFPGSPGQAAFGTLARLHCPVCADQPAMAR